MKNIKKLTLLTAIIIAINCTTISTSNIQPNQETIDSQLFLAVINQDKKEVQRLLAQGANPNIQQSKTSEDSDIKTTALKIAIENNNPEIVQVLLDAKADPNLIIADPKTFFGPYSTTPLHDAVNINNYDIVKMLLNAGANPNIETHCRRVWYSWGNATPLELAKSKKNPNLKIIALLRAYYWLPWLW